MKLIERPIYLDRLKRVKGSPDIKIITGIRRCGKSKLLAAFEGYIRSSEPTANIISIDLTKLRFEALKDYHKLNEYVEERYKDGESNYLLIDEVQLCDKFELVINSLHSEEKYDIYLTGSNAFLLSSDLATLFTGRHINIHVFPFSFKEYCDYFSQDRDIQKQLISYIKVGGLAGSYVYEEDADKEKYIRDVYETILLRDLVDKYKLGNPGLLRKIGDFMMDNVGNITSSRNITSGLISGDTDTNHVTVGNYIGYLDNAFVFYEAKRYDIKGKTVSVSAMTH